MSDYCQFNLDFAGSSIRGRKVNEDERYFTIKNPIFNPKPVHPIDPSDAAIRLSKDAVVCYFLIERS